MKYSLKASSIVESMVVLLIVVSGIVGVYSILDSSQKLANSTWDRIEAIQIARDGLEAFTNIRDTNALLFELDLENCWNTMNYNNACIWNTWVSTDIRNIANRAYSIYKAPNNQFMLWRRNTAGWFNDSWYRNRFWVRKDDRGFYTQSWGILMDSTYTREIQVEYFQADDTPWNSNNPKVQVTSLVQWFDPTSGSAKSLEMSTTLTNWRGEK